MTKETFYFKHDCNARTDRKLVNVRMRHGLQGIGLYWCLVEMLYEEGGYLPFEYERISFELGTNMEITESIIKDFELFKYDEKRFWSDSVLERLQERCDKSEKARHSINKRWNKLGKHTNVIRPENERNTKEKSIVKESIVKDKKDKYSPEGFEDFWKAYPKKVNKKEAITAFRKAKFTSLEIILKAVEKQKQSDQWLKDNGTFIPYPSSWLNKERWDDEVKINNNTNNDPFKGAI